jgi:hypothetical protein
MKRSHSNFLDRAEELTDLLSKFEQQLDSALN